MNTISDLSSTLTPKSFVESMIRVGLIGLLAISCLRIATPFLNILIWGLMLAIMLYPLHQKIARKLSGKQGLAATLMVLVVCLVIGPPIILLSGTFVGEIKEFKTAYQNGEVAVSAPDPSVKEWPVIGEKAFQAWDQASTDLPMFLREHASQLEDLGAFVFSAAGDALGGVVLIFAAFFVAGLMMAFGKQGTAAMGRVFSRLAGPQGGPNILELIVATVRSVATGVLGVAVIQALLFGIGLMLAGIPAAGLLALVVLFMGIIQLPATIVGLPVIIFLWTGGDGSTVANIFFTVYFLVAGLADNVLKPLLLGRGVKAPMPVILIGAIGGMITAGLVGLFVGALVLAVGYQLFMLWTDGAPADSVPSD